MVSLVQSRQRGTRTPALADVVSEQHRFQAAEPVNAMSVDVEDYFQVSAFEPQFATADWSQIPCRIPRNIDNVLELFSSAQARATFFVLGWVAEHHPQVVRTIAAQGHEIASHGHLHRRANHQTREEFRNDVTRTKKLLEDIIGKPVLGYRAPSYSIDLGNLWALEILQETGHLYSSSIYPIRHDLYGIPDAPRFAFRTRPGAILELPVSTIAVAGHNFPCGGGGYFRLLPYKYSRWALERLNRSEQQPGIFYFHPWEVDPDQPRVRGASLRSRLRHYSNLRAMRAKLATLLQDFRWDRMDHVFGLSKAAGRDPVNAGLVAAGR
jgi:polysaccharide deacetylase family protein (PEP-CTERM system associated)